MSGEPRALCEFKRRGEISWNWPAQIFPASWLCTCFFKVHLGPKSNHMENMVVDTDSQLHPTCETSRQYPSGFGHCLRQAFETHLAAAVHRDLRFKVQVNKLDPVAQFESLPMGDLWEDANLLQPMLYAMSSKHIRTFGGSALFCDMCALMCSPFLSPHMLFCRIPPEWQSTMEKFVADYKAEVLEGIMLSHFLQLNKETMTNQCLWQVLGDPQLRAEYEQLLTEHT